MSQGDPIPRARALAIADRLTALLAPACAQIAIAGSLRRERELVRDVEVVVEPRWEERDSGDLWGAKRRVDVLEETIARLLAAGVLEPRKVENHRKGGGVDVQEKLGPAYKALVLDRFPVDLFVVRPPAQWGVIFGLRTGPADWNIELVTMARKHLRAVVDGQVLALGKPVATPTEASFLRALGQPWVEPRDRRPARVRFVASIRDGTSS